MTGRRAPVLQRTLALLKGETSERFRRTGEVQPEQRLPACLSLCGIFFLPPSFPARRSLLSLAGRSLIAINFLISSAFPIMDNNRKAVIGF